MMDEIFKLVPDATVIVMPGVRHEAPYRASVSWKCRTVFSGGCASPEIALQVVLAELRKELSEEDLLG